MTYVPSYQDDPVKFRERMEAYKRKVKYGKRIKKLPVNGSKVGAGRTSVG